MSAAKMAAAISIVLGLIAAVMMVLLDIFTVFSTIFFPLGSRIAGTDPLSEILQIVVTTVSLAITGFIAGGLAAFVYNMSATMIGGVRLRFKEDKNAGIEDREEATMGYE